MIRKLSAHKFVLYSKKKDKNTGKRKKLGSFQSRKAALAREKQVQSFKHMGEDVDSWGLPNLLTPEQKVPGDDVRPFEIINENTGMKDALQMASCQSGQRQIALASQKTSTRILSSTKMSGLSVSEEINTSGLLLKCLDESKSSKEKILKEKTMNSDVDQFGIPMDESSRLDRAMNWEQEVILGGKEYLIQAEIDFERSLVDDFRIYDAEGNAINPKQFIARKDFPAANIEDYIADLASK